MRAPHQVLQELPPEQKAAAALGAGTASGGGLGVLFVWGFGQLGVDMPNEVAAVVGSVALGVGTAVGAYGLVGCIQRVLYGRQGRNR